MSNPLARRRRPPHLPRRLAASLGLGLLLALVPPSSLRADEDLPSPEEEERLEAIERHTERGWKALRSGNHEEVLARMERLARYDPESPLPGYLRGRVHARTGDYEKAREEAAAGLAAHPTHRGLEALLFEALFALGRDEEALSTADARLAGRPGDLVAATAAGWALEERGRREEALERYDGVIEAYNAGDPPAEELPWVARAAIRAMRLSTNPADDLLRGALRLLGDHLERVPEDQDVLLLVADLYQADRGPRGQTLALKYYRRLLEANPEVAEARVGVARSLLIFYQQDRAVAELERALQTNPNLVPALRLLAAVHVGNGDYEKADELLDRALAVNPLDKETRAVRAARWWIAGDEAAYEALEREVLEHDPYFATFYLVVSELVGERQRRYDVAAEFARKAIETDPNDPLGYVTLGEALMNLGRTDEARGHFETAVDRAKRYKDVKRDNWLKVLDILEGFAETRTERFVVRMHPTEAPVMRHYLPDLLEASWDVLAEKYGFEPARPVLVDAFHRVDDFSVRSVGVEGLPALGVCFGGVITLLGPTSRPVGSFSWSRTAWHEFAHVVTLQLSRGQVPRWLTEGLSVYEEQARRPDWGRDMERELFDRLHNDRLLPLGRINRAFRGPDIGFAYYQGGLICQHLVENWGFEVIPRMLREFAEDRTTAEVFQEVLGIELADYDQRFRQFVEGLVGHYALVPRWSDQSLARFQDRVRSDPEDVEAWTRLGWAHLQRRRSIDAGAALAEAMRRAPDDPQVVLLQGRLAQANERADLAEEAYRRFLAMGEEDLEVRLFLASREIERGEDTSRAVEHLEAAKHCFPRLLGPQSPYLRLATLYRGEGDVARAVAELEGYAAVAAEDYGVRRELKAWYMGLGDHERVAALSAEMIDVSPFGANRGDPPDASLHRDYAEALVALGREEEALRERRVQVEVLATLPEPERRQAGAVEDHVRLGEMLLDARRPLEALEQAVAALRLSPEHAGARMLKARAEEAAGYR